jgi:hypothetical protein
LQVEAARITNVRRGGIAAPGAPPLACRRWKWALAVYLAEEDNPAVAVWEPADLAAFADLAAADLAADPEDLAVAASGAAAFEAAGANGRP